jgi:hypothetical protein
MSILKSTLSLLAISSLLILSGCLGRDAQYDEFAQCLADEEVVMYGAFWCPHCGEQKELFGDSKDLLTYVECDARGDNPQVELCAEKEIESYPTWIHSDGRRWSGTQPLESLSKVSGCELPSDEEVETEGETTPEPVEEEVAAEAEETEAVAEEEPTEVVAS